MSQEAGRPCGDYVKDLALAVSTQRLPVLIPTGKRNVSFTIEITGAAGLTTVLSLKYNNRSKHRYFTNAGLINGESDPDKVTKEAANTAGWCQKDMSPTATFTFTGNGNHTIDGEVEAERCRLEFVTSAGSAVVNIDAKVS